MILVMIIIIITIIIIMVTIILAVIIITTSTTIDVFVPFHFHMCYVSHLIVTCCCVACSASNSTVPATFIYCYICMYCCNFPVL